MSPQDERCWNVSNSLTVWDDRMLVAGDDWDTEIREKVRSADLVVFLVLVVNF